MNLPKQLPEDFISACESFKGTHSGSNIITRQLFGNVRDMSNYLVAMLGAVNKARTTEASKLRGRVSDYVDATVEHHVGILRSRLAAAIQMHRADFLLCKRVNEPPQERDGDKSFLALIGSLGRKSLNR